MRLPLFIILALFIISIAVNAYIYFSIPRPRPGKLRWRRIYLLIAIAVMILLVVAVSMPRRGEASLVPVMRLLFAYLTILIPQIIFCLFSILGTFPRLWKGKPLPTGRWIGIPLGCIVFVLMWWGSLVTAKQVDVRKIEIESPKIPISFSDYKIVQFSDAHVGTWGENTNFINKLVDSINAQHPDLIVFTGDLVNRRSLEAVPFVKAFKRLKAKDGVYSVMGNHDYGNYMNWNSEKDHLADQYEIRRLQRDMGWHVLDNSHKFLSRENDSIVLIGVENWGEPPFGQYGDLDIAFPGSKLKDAGDNTFKILLSHNPEHWRRVVSKKTNVDLTLSGHTHAMQTEVRAGDYRWSPAAWIYPDWGGMYTAKTIGGQESKLYVNIGAGAVGIPFRIGAVPEITVITLKHSNKNSK